MRLDRLTAVLLVVLSISASAGTLTLQPGPEGKDAEVNTDHMTENYGDAKFVVTNWCDG